jgi:hypothetical protein
MPSFAELAASMAGEAAVSAQSTSTSAELTRRGALVGTMPYMSPEQWGVDTVDHRTDLWAAGILLYRMVVGRHPLARCTGMQFMVAADLEKPMPSARNACPSMSDELATVIDLCLMKRKAERMSSAHELIMTLEALLPASQLRPLRTDESPYPGLSAFQEKDADRFFGRAREITAAVTRLGDLPLLTVAGPSGVGKSSFVRAGVVPALKHSGQAWASLVIRPGRQPVAMLAELIAPMGEHSETTVAHHLTELGAIHQHLYNEPGYLGAILRSRARRTGQNVLLFVDQFEELYTLVSEERERKAFTACLAGVADDVTSPLRVIISIRSDFLDRVPEDEHFMAELTRGLLFLTPPGREGLREALVQPAELAGHGFESTAMVDHMLDHLQETPGALPLLQFAASKLWDARDRRRRMLTERSYRDLGGIAGALASHADAVLSGLSLPDQALARSVLLRLVTPERTRGIISIDELDALSRQPGAMRRLIDHLAHARLLVVQTGAGGASVELVHESLIHGWPLLRRWLDENQDDAAFVEQLRTAARQWLAKKYASGLLWRGDAADEARRWRQRYRGELTDLEETYLQAVFSLGARTARIKRHAVVGLIVFLSILVSAAAVALLVIRDAKTRATDQAEVAQRAEKQVREQLARVEAEERRRKQAETRALAEKDKADQANVQLDRANDELQRRNQALVLALDRAEEARQRARRARKRAQANAEDARHAEADAHRANQELKDLLERERERMRRMAIQEGTSSLFDQIPLE